jgi:hypothetical protein
VGGEGVRIGLMAPDSTIPNLAIMKLSAWHKAQGDTIIFPWRGQRVDRLLASVVFTRNRKEAEHLPTYAEIGGTGWDYTTTLPDEIEALKPDYDLYGIDYGMGFLWRGCVNKCLFCVVWRKEPEFKQAASIDALLNPRSNRLVLLDNNLTAAPNVVDLLAEMAERRLRVNFSQGLDIRRMTPEIAAALAKVNFSNHTFTSKQVHFAWDSVGLEQAVKRGVAILKEAGIKPYRLMFYMLCGFGTTWEEDWHRFEVLRELGCDPYVMTYQDLEGKAVEQDPRLRHFERWVNARIYKACHWEDYKPAQEAIAKASGQQTSLFKEASA